MKNLLCMLRRPFLVYCIIFSLGNFTPLKAQKIGFHLPANQESVTLPFKLINNLIILELSLNGQETASFILDTGVRTPLFFNKGIIDKLNSTKIREVNFSGVGQGKPLKGQVYFGLNMKIGELEGFNMPLVLVKGKRPLRISNYHSIDGILGYQIFYKFAVEINYANRQLTLFRANSFKPDKQYQGAPLEIEDTKPYLVSQIDIREGNKKEVKLLIDTGANHFLLLESSEQFPKSLPHDANYRHIGKGLAGNIRGYVGTVKSFKLLEYELNNVTTAFLDTGMYSKAQHKDNRNGSIGNQLLANFVVVFDYSRQMLFIKEKPKLGLGLSDQYLAGS